MTTAEYQARADTISELRRQVAFIEEHQSGETTYLETYRRLSDLCVDTEARANIAQEYWRQEITFLEACQLLAVALGLPFPDEPHEYLRRWCRNDLDAMP